MLKRILTAVILIALAIPGIGAEAAPPPAALAEARLTGLDDRVVGVARYWGRPLVVNFWARWCGPCRAELPALVEARSRFQARGVEVLGIALETRAELVQAFMRVYGVDYPTLLLKEQGPALLKALGDESGGLPFTVAFDRRGKEVFRKLGALTKDEIDAAFAAAAE